VEAAERDKARRQIEEEFNADVTYEVVRHAGQHELERTTSALAWSGFAAGLSMACSLLVQALLESHLPEAGWAPLVVKLGYPVGFLIVILASQQLYTENTLTAVVPVLADRGMPWIERIRRVGRVWAVVLVANLAGAHVAAWVAARTTAFDPPVRDAFAAIGRQAMGDRFPTMLLQAVIAGWLIALMVWMLPAAKHAKVPVIFAITWIVGAAGLPHIIAGSVDVLYLVWRGEIPWTSYAGRYLVPALLGNTIGGTLLVAALNHAQVTADKQRGAT